MRAAANDRGVDGGVGVRVAVLANGEWDVDWGRAELAQVDYLVCADGGADAAIQSGRLPDALVGDLDSITPENLAICEQAGIEVLRYPRQKDETDLELALERAADIAQPGADILLYGGTGGRIDHFLGNLALLLGYARQGRRLRLKDPQHEMWVLQGRESIHGEQNKELSLIVLSETAVVTTQGLYYPLDQATLVQHSPRSVSNVLIEEDVVIEVHSGWVLVVLLK